MTQCSVLSVLTSPNGANADGELMSTDAVDLFISLFNTAVFVVVAVVSFRRSRRLGRYPLWRSVIIGVIAGLCWPLWAIVSLVNRAQIAREWDMYRAARAASPV